jgi:hypothetical protein
MTRGKHKEAVYQTNPVRCRSSPLSRSVTYLRNGAIHNVRRIYTGLFLVAPAAIVVAGCGGTSHHQARPTLSATSPLTSTSAAASAAPPGCSKFCLNAGPEGRPVTEGCHQANGRRYSERTPSGCLPCPTRECLAVLSTIGVASNGVVSVKIRCRLPTPCEGALVILQPGKEIAPDGNKRPPAEWVGGSDFRVQRNGTAIVAIGLTPLGKRLVQTSSGYRAELNVQLKMYEVGSNGSKKLLIAMLNGAP